MPAILLLAMLSGTEMRSQKIDSTLEPIETRSLFGRPLRRPKLGSASQVRLQSDLDQALTHHKAEPDHVDKYIWVGRRMAYLGRYRDAADWFKKGLKLSYDEPAEQAKLLRHLGHRQITLRQFNAARTSLTKAWKLVQAGVPDEIEPDGIPNSKNQPLTSLHTNISYHLGLVCHLLGDHRAARNYFALSNPARTSNPDRFVSSRYWEVVCAMSSSADKSQIAEMTSSVPIESDVIENGAYRRLLLSFNGSLTTDLLMRLATGSNDAATCGYGVSVLDEFEDRRSKSIERRREILELDTWAAFGYIAAEASLFRDRSPEIDLPHN